jgi:hypothetical protein
MFLYFVKRMGRMGGTYERNETEGIIRSRYREGGIQGWRGTESRDKEVRQDAQESRDKEGKERRTRKREGSGRKTRKRRIGRKRIKERMKRHGKDRKKVGRRERKKEAKGGYGTESS